jgi:GntR family transcriptional regulator
LGSIFMPQTTDPSPASVLIDAGSTASTPLAASFSPLYQQIKGLILNSLRLGEWKPGESIPSEKDLATRFRVSQGTVRKAVDELASENLLDRRQGKGTFVATHATQQAQFRFLKLVPETGMPGSEGPAQRDIVECRRTRASADVAHALALRTGDAVLQVRRVLSFAGAPTILEDIWLPATPFKGLTAARLANYQGPMYALFETEFNVRMVRAEEKIRAEPAVDGREKLLKIEIGTPLLSVERIAYTYKDVPMELRRGYYRTDTHYYHNTLG